MITDILTRERYDLEIYKSLQNANAKSVRQGYWSTLDEIVREAKLLGVQVGWGWNKLDNSLHRLARQKLVSSAEVWAYVPHCMEKLGIPTGYETVWRDAKFTLAELRDTFSKD